MEIRYLHETMQPLLPALGDIRVIPVLKYKTQQDGQIERPYGKIYIVKCIEIKDHHAIYEYLGENKAEAIPFEVIENWGMLNIDSAVKWILNSFMSDIISSTKKDSVDALSVPSSVSDYFTKLKDLVVLSREVLKEAERARKILSTTINKGN